MHEPTMSKLRSQAEATRESSRPKDSESPHKILAQRMLEQWGKEMNQGSGAPNILAVFERLGDGDPVFHISPGPIFSPMAQRTDRILRDLRLHDPRTAALLMATALDFSHRSIANALDTNKDRVKDDLHEAYGCFSTSFFYLTQVLKVSPDRTRRMVAQDIGLEKLPTLHPDLNPPRKALAEDFGFDNGAPPL